MKNLQSFGVYELDANQLLTIDGGWWKEVLVAAAYILENWNKLGEAAQSGASAGASKW